VSGLATVVVTTLAFGFDEGLAVGLLSGGMTHSAALGTGLSAIAELPIDGATKAKLTANAPFQLDPTLTLEPGDRLVLSARRGAFLDAERDIGPEIDDPAPLSVPFTTATVVVTPDEAAGRDLGDLAQNPSTLSHTPSPTRSATSSSQWAGRSWSPSCTPFEGKA
jgi:uncharacterized transporter YbjL